MQLSKVFLLPLVAFECVGSWLICQHHISRYTSAKQRAIKIELACEWKQLSLFCMFLKPFTKAGCHFSISQDGGSEVNHLFILGKSHPPPKAQQLFVGERKDFLAVICLKRGPRFFNRLYLLDNRIALLEVQKYLKLFFVLERKMQKILFHEWMKINDFSAKSSCFLFGWVGNICKER